LLFRNIIGLDNFDYPPVYLYVNESYFIRKKTAMLRKQSNTIMCYCSLVVFSLDFLLFNHVYIFFLLCSTSSSRHIFLLSDSSTNDAGFQFDPCSKNKVSSARRASYFLFLFGWLDKFSLSSHESIA
jgi:hypothetical protein